MVTSWVRDSCFQKTLLDGGSLVELINRKLVMKMWPRPKIFSDSRIKVSLANDSVTVLSEYVKIPVNVQGVEAVVRAWLVDVGVYDLLLGVPWMRRVNWTQVYGEGKVTIMGNDLCVMDVPSLRQEFLLIWVSLLSSLMRTKRPLTLTRHAKIFWTNREKYSSDFSASKKSELKLINWQIFYISCSINTLS